MKNLPARLSSALLSVSLGILGSLAIVSPAHARPAVTDAPICIEYDVIYAKCKSVYVDEVTGKETTVETDTPITPSATDNEQAKKAGDACIAAGKALRDKLDTEAGGPGKSKVLPNKSGKQVLRIKNTLVGIKTVHYKICIPKGIFDLFKNPVSCNDSGLATEYLAATEPSLDSGSSCGEVESDFDPAALSSDELNRLLEQGSTLETLSTETTELNTPLDSN